MANLSGARDMPERLQLRRAGPLAIVLAPCARLLILAALAGCTAPGQPASPSTELSAEQTFSNGDYSGALIVFNKVLGEQPSNARALAHRAQLYNMIGQNDLALRDVNAAVALDGGTALALSVRALVLQNIKQDQALADANRAIALLQKGPAPPNPEFAALDAEDRSWAISSAYTVRAEINSRLGRLDPALADADAMIDYDPTMAAAWLVRASIERQQARFLDALADDLKARTFNADAQVILSLCTDYGAVGPLEQAARSCAEALSIYPHSGIALAGKALVELKLGDSAAAQADFNASVQQYPADYISLYGRGLARAMAGDTRGGQADMSEALAHAPAVAKWFSDRAVSSALPART